MKVKLKYFGLIAEFVGKSEEEIEVNPPSSVEMVKSILNRAYPELDNIAFSIAINQKMVTDEKVLCAENDEIALFPPFAGG